jgi:hypothetical protein
MFNKYYTSYKTTFCRTRFLEHEERSEECYKANKCERMAYKTSVIQYFLYNDARKIIFCKKNSNVNEK